MISGEGAWTTPQQHGIGIISPSHTGSQPSGLRTPSYQRSWPPDASVSNVKVMHFRSQYDDLGHEMISLVERSIMLPK